MKYLIVENGVIVNIILADESFAAENGAVPYYDGADIGKAYVRTPTKEEQARADIDYLAAMAGVTL